LNRPISISAGAVGGAKPYKFVLSGGQSLPAGLTGPDPLTGVISGTPTAAGQYNFTVIVSDSSNPTQIAVASFTPVAGAALGRNDTPSTATRLGNGFFQASISPYIDPPNGVPNAADGDYFKLLAKPGAIVHAQTNTGSGSLNGILLDTVMEITDANGLRLSTCRQPGDTSTNFSSLCLNDDINSSNTDSALDFQVPTTANPVLTLLVHVIDWRGDARPDLTYSMNVSDVVDPVTVPFPFLPSAALGSAYNAGVFAQGGISPYTYSLAAGSTLPPGINMDPSGVFSGTPTARGSFTFTVQITDTIPETGTAQLTIQVL
jgi:hypothetical protein